MLALGEKGRRAHPIGRYIAAFPDKEWRVIATLALGGDSVVFKLSSGTVLHITNKILTPELGKRFFDLPMIERGAVDTAGGVLVYYFIQPEAQAPVSERALAAFTRAIEAQGWLLSDHSVRQVGIFKGEAKLIDPFAVERIPFWRR